VKLSTSIRNAITVAERIRALSGVIETPEASRPFVRIKRAWIFGSTAKGKQNPNDTDILLEMHVCGDYQPSNVRRNHKCKRYAKTDRKFLRRRGVNTGLRSEDVALRYLKKSMKKISLHSMELDGEYATDRIMIYPRNDLKNYVI